MKKYIRTIMLICTIAAMATMLTGCAAMEDDTVSQLIGELIAGGVSIIAQVVMAALGIGLTWLISRMGKTEKLRAMTEVLTQLSSTVETTVRELQQTVVDDLKAASADGKLSPDDVALLKNDVLLLVKRKLSQPAMDMLLAAQVDINALISGMAESVIQQIKADSYILPIATLEGTQV